MSKDDKDIEVICTFKPGEVITREVIIKKVNEYFGFDAELNIEIGVQEDE